MTRKDLITLQRLMESRDHTPYMEGNCGSLALKLHDKTNWPIVVLSNPEGEPWYIDDDEDGMEYTHIAIEHPSGKYLDAQGLRSNSEISNDFGLDYMDSYEISREQLIYLLSDDGPFDCWLDDEEVEEYANYILQKI